MKKTLLIILSLLFLITSCKKECLHPIQTEIKEEYVYKWEYSEVIENGVAYQIYNQDYEIVNISNFIFKNKRIQHPFIEGDYVYVNDLKDSFQVTIIDRNSINVTLVELIKTNPPSTGEIKLK